MTIRALRFLLALAVFSLVLNDVARLAFPDVFQTVLAQQRSQDEEERKDGNNPTNTLFEEEVKHKATKEYPDYAALEAPNELDAAVAHLITDDDVRHLAFLPIFSPPPNCA